MLDTTVNIMSSPNLLSQNTKEKNTVRCNLNIGPTISTNNLKDIIDWLNFGDYVVIHDNWKYGRFFHTKCSADDCMSDEAIKQFLENCRIIYINVSSHSSLLDDGEWEYYIKSANHQECTCKLKKRIVDPNELPYCYYLTLGY